MAFFHERIGDSRWEGADLAFGEDDWEFRALLGCLLSRLSVLDPVDTFGYEVPTESVQVAQRFVDHWWDLLASGDELEDEWLERIEEAAEPVRAGSGPTRSILFAGSLLLRAQASCAEVWERTALRFDESMPASALQNWISNTYPSSPVRPKLPPEQDFLQFRSSLPSQHLFDETLDYEAEFVNQPDAPNRIDELRANAEQAGRTYEELRRIEDQLVFPGPGAPLGDVLDLVATLKT